MREHAVEWLLEHQADVMTSENFEQFCKSHGTIGKLYLTYQWLPRYYRTLKTRGFIPYRALEIPEARAFTDLFTNAVIVKQVAHAVKKGTAYPAPSGYYYISESRIEPSIAGHYGGKRTLDPTRTYGDGTPIRCHYGATWYVCYVEPKPEVAQYLYYPSGPRFESQAGSFSAIKHEDGVLITTEGRTSIGSTWVALLDKGDMLESLLSAEDQEFLRREREAEENAYAIVGVE